MSTNSSKGPRTFFFYFLLAMVLLTVIVVGLFTMDSFFTTRDLIDKNSLHTQYQTEQDISEVIRLVDASFTLFDNSLNEQMHRGLDRVMQEYSRAGNDPAAMDLGALRRELGDQFDIYLINESGVIEYTTYQPEQGLDFKTIPYFYEYLTSIRNSEGFFPDRIVKESRGTDSLRKYAYMPTPDHRYILELGLNASAFSKDREELNYQNVINSIAANNPSIENVRIYDVTGQLVDNATYVPDEITTATLMKVIGNRSGTVVPQPAIGKSVTYIFIDLKNKEYGSDLSRIVEITYNETPLEMALSHQFAQIILIALLALVVGCGGAVILSRLISQPIAGIVSDVDRIAKGDLDHRIASPDVTEFMVLEQSINHMVASLREALDKIRESDEALRESEQKYRNLYISARIALFEINLTSNTLVSGNQQLYEIFGIQVQEVDSCNRLLTNYVDPRDLEDAAAILRSDGFFNGREMQFKNTATGKVFWGEVSARVKNGGDLAEGSIVDITLRKEAEAELHTLYHELESRIADRTAELEAAHVAYRRANTTLNLLNTVTRHDVLNQLTVVKGYLTLFEIHAAQQDPRIREYIRRAQQAAESIEDQIQFTKTFQDIGVHAPAWQKVEGLIDKAKAGLLPESVSLTINLGGLEIFADPLLEKTVYTLLDNAVRHGVHVTEIRFFYTITGDETLHLIYEDNGAGISFDDKPHLFEQGFGKNTGFGLFLAKEILSITGLVIEENGEPGRGARFVISVPKDEYRFRP